MKPKLLIFDFDGTLADTKKEWISSLIRILKNEKIYCPSCEARIIIHFGKKIIDILRAIEIPEKDAERIAQEVHREFNKTMTRVKLCPGFEDLSNIQGIKIIVSNSETEVVNKILKKNQKAFLGVYGGDKFNEKPTFIKELMSKYKIGRKSTFYIGDRAGDVKVARESGCTSVVISNKCSWNSRVELLEEKPDFIVGSLGELALFFN